MNATTNELFKFDASYNENTTIKAKWVAEKEYTVQFDLNPEGAQLTVKKNGSDTAIQPDSSSGSRVVYKLTKGTYTYSVSANGYKTIHNTQTIDEKFEEKILSK